MNLAALIGLKVQPMNDDDLAESQFLRSMDRWGDLTVCGHDATEFAIETRYYFEPKVRRRLRYQAAILRS